jgi:hypothetical protein
LSWRAWWIHSSEKRRLLSRGVFLMCVIKLSVSIKNLTLKLKSFWGIFSSFIWILDHTFRFKSTSVHRCLNSLCWNLWNHLFGHLNLYIARNRIFLFSLSNRFIEILLAFSIWNVSYKLLLIFENYSIVFSLLSEVFFIQLCFFKQFVYVVFVVFFIVWILNLNFLAHNLLCLTFFLFQQY